MGDLAAWLSAVHKTCVELLGPLDDDYGVETVQDLLNLEPEDIDKLVEKLKRSPGKNQGCDLEFCRHVDRFLVGLWHVDHHVDHVDHRSYEHRNGYMYFFMALLQ